MKKLVPVFVTVLLVATIALLVISRAQQVKYLTVYIGNETREPVEIIIDHYQDTQCGMLLDRLKDSAQAVATDGKTWFFDDVGCLALWLEDNKNRDEMVLWVYSRDTNEWIDARNAWYSKTDRTPMNYGFGAYYSQAEDRIVFDEMYRKMLRGENLTNPYIKKELLGK
ncbi:MAG: hypothetical protein GY780_00570 [bacterium]|nr:hypothetical protein [bacterium]